MLTSAPRRIFFRQNLSESLGIALLCLRFLSRLAKKSLAVAVRSLNQRLMMCDFVFCFFNRLCEDTGRITNRETHERRERVFEIMSFGFSLLRCVTFLYW